MCLTGALAVAGFGSDAEEAVARRQMPLVDGWLNGRRWPNATYFERYGDSRQ